MIKKLSILAITVLLTLGLSLSLQSVLADWSAPSGNPPTQNIQPPLNEGSANQAKLGGLALGGNLLVTGTTSIQWRLGINTTNPQNRLDIAGGDINMDDNTTIYSRGRQNLYGENALYLLNRSGVYVSNGWGGTDAGKLFISSSAYSPAYYYSSDMRLKENIKPLDRSLEKILGLKGRSFDWKSTGEPDMGLIAQEVEEIYPELVHVDPSTGMKSVEYGHLIAPLIEAIKEQQKQIDELKVRIEKAE